jgi:hypothetical protein
MIPRPATLVATGLASPRFSDRLQHEHERNSRRQSSAAARRGEKALPGRLANGTREDEYYWLRDDKRENTEMLAYVKAENAYADAVLAHTKPLGDEGLQRDHRPACSRMTRRCRTS